MDAELNNLLQTAIQIQNDKKTLEDQYNQIRDKIKIRMKELELENFEDDDGNSITMKMCTRESLDKKKVLQFLAENEYKECLKLSKYETTTILSASSKSKMKQFIK